MYRLLNVWFVQMAPDKSCLTSSTKILQNFCQSFSFLGRKKTLLGGETKRRRKSFETILTMTWHFFHVKIVYFTLTSKREECVLMVSSKNCWVWGSMTNDLREACKQKMEQFKWQPEMYIFTASEMTRFFKFVTCVQKELSKKSYPKSFVSFC